MVFGHRITVHTEPFVISTRQYFLVFGIVAGRDRFAWRRAQCQQVTYEQTKRYQSEEPHTETAPAFVHAELTRSACEEMLTLAVQQRQRKVVQTGRHQCSVQKRILKQSTYVVQKLRRVTKRAAHNLVACDWHWMNSNVEDDRFIWQQCVIMLSCK